MSTGLNLIQVFAESGDPVNIEKNEWVELHEGWDILPMATPLRYAPS